MRLGRAAADLFTLKYQTKHFLYCEVSIKQDTEEKCWVSGIRFTGRQRLRGGGGSDQNRKDKLDKIISRELDGARIKGNNI